MALNLPLRLAAEPVARARLGNCFIIPSKDDENRVCMIIGEDGLLALALDKIDYTDKELEGILGLDAACLPQLRVIVDTAKNSYTWIGPAVADKRDPVSRQCDCADPAHRCLAPQRIVEGIHKYYARQVLEPSIRGFLSILEKQFPRNDLYLFELLQNAVDDGASIVSFSTTRDALEFTHNGKRFTALDVLGLASVGLSTKGSDGAGPKRTIGFMGVGFKAVYKRYARVVIGDNRYGFVFQEPDKPNANIPGHGWVMLPRWSPPSGTSSSSSSSSGGGGAKHGWCRFLLEAPRGGVQSVAADMRNLPRTVPPLLGRQSLENGRRLGQATQADKADWTLEWGSTRHRVSRPVKATPRDMLPTARPQDKWFGGSESLEVDITEAQAQARKTHWQFITLRFAPDEAAKSAYETHIKRAWVGAGTGAAALYEETSLFFEVDANHGIPVVSAKGAVHAVLPTKLTLPCPLQWQGSWLLSVDRQEVQNVVDNDWNSCLLRQAPKLLACILAWLVGANDARLYTPAGLRSVFYLFPQMERSGGGPEGEAGRDKFADRAGGSLTAHLLGQRVLMRPLVDFMSTNAVVPVRSLDASLGFMQSSKVIWLPAPLVTRLPAAALEKWLGLLPLATDALCDGTGYMPLWQQCLAFPSARLLGQRRHGAREALRWDGAGSSMCAAVNLLAALGEVAEIDLDRASASFLGAASRPKPAPPAGAPASKGDKDHRDDSGSLFGSWIAPLHNWPIFFDARGAELTAPEVVWLSEEFVSLPSAVWGLLRPGALAVCQTRAAEDGVRSSNSGGGGGGNASCALLDPAIERFVLTGLLPPRTSLVAPWRVDDEARWAALEGDKALLPACRALFAKCREAHPAMVVTPVEACAGLLSTYVRAAGKASHAPLGAAELAACEQLFQWAFSSNLPQAMSHLLIEAGPSSSSSSSGSSSGSSSSSSSGSSSSNGTSSGGVGEKKNLRLVPSFEAYIDGSYLPEAAWLERFLDPKGGLALQVCQSHVNFYHAGKRPSVPEFLIITTSS